MNEKQYIGLSDPEIIASRSKYGSNIVTPPKKTPWWKLYLEKFKDPIILILLVATAVSLVFGIYNNDYTESIGIVCAIFIATGVGFWQEYSAQLKFDSMKSDQDYELVKVRRNHTVVEITKDQLVVGDIVLLSAGDEIPADILLFESTDMKVSEASITGESQAVAKCCLEEKEIFQGPGLAPNLLLRGTNIVQGMGEGYVEKVGDATEIGKTTRLASEETGLKSPLQNQLNRLARKINSAAFIIAGLMMTILNIVHWDNPLYTFDWTLESTWLTEMEFLMEAVVVIILAVPEGLPLSTTLALAFSMKTMAKENNLVKKMHASETIGAVNVIFTDKTGTLTQNSMSVVNAEVTPKNVPLFNLVGALNATANWSNETKVIGNPTEGAILKYIGQETTEKLRETYHVVHRILFSSAKKYMVTMVEHKETHTTYILIKGAPEVIARLINHTEFIANIRTQQDRGRRCLSAAIIKNSTFSEVKAILNQGQTFPEADYIGSWFIEDPVREDVPASIAHCYRAGIDVVMLTGDNIKTGSEIARQSGFKDLWAINARDFFVEMKAKESTSELNKAPSRKLPNVIARCTPTQKVEILRWAQAHNYICAMTGDGVNDGPSLNYADVGIAMGSGTSVAKEAADIILLNDAFPSIVTGIKWGRSLYKNIKNFLYLQLSINVSACLIAIFSPLVGVEMPFSVTQFLWINLVMDSLGAIAIASEPADDNVLDEQPRKKNAFIINKKLAQEIFGFGGCIWILFTAILLYMHQQNPGLSGRELTLFFALYMLTNWWNFFYARVIGKNKSLFNKLFKNKRFIFITLTVLVGTILIVQFGGKVFQTQPLDFMTWVKVIAVTSPICFIRELVFQIKKKYTSYNA